MRAIAGVLGLVLALVATPAQAQSADAFRAELGLVAKRSAPCGILGASVQTGFLVAGAWRPPELPHVAGTSFALFAPCFAGSLVLAAAGGELRAGVSIRKVVRASRSTAIVAGSVAGTLLTLFPGFVAMWMFEGPDPWYEYATFITFNLGVFGANLFLLQRIQERSRAREMERFDDP